MARRPVQAFDPKPEDPTAAVKWMNARKREAERAYADILANGMPRQAEIFRHAAVELIEHDNPAFFEAISEMVQIPVGIDEFMDSSDFLACDTREPLMEFWPNLRPVIRQMNPDVVAGETPLHAVYMAGACHAAGTEILMFDGTLRRIEDVVVGDLVMGPDSTPRTVMSLARGRQEMFRITPHRGGEPFVVNRDHILSLTRVAKTNAKTDNLRGQTVNIRVGDYLSRSKTFRHMHKLTRCPVEFAPGGTLPIPPYILGLWLGDGSSHRPTLTSADPEPVKEWIGYSESLGLTVRTQTKPGNAATEYHATTGNVGGSENPLTALLREACVLDNKHIPHPYLTASRADRLDLLAGLLDTDGHLYSGMFDFVQKSRTLADHTVYLARSLGLRASMSEKRVHGSDTVYWRVKISGDTAMVPCRIPRKKATSRVNRNPLLSGFSAESLGEGDYYGFELDGDHLYLTGDFTRHHNTGWGKSFGALATNLYQVYLMTCYRNPHKLFKLSKETTPIVFMFMSASGTLAKRTLYQPFRNAFTNMRYAKKYLTWNRFKESQLELAQGIIVAPALADLKSILGQAIPGGIVDEINFMSVVENSTQVAGPTGQGGRYDQAEIVVSNLLRRRRRSFATSGISMGTLCLPSSTLYKGDFLDRQIEEVEKIQQDARNRGVQDNNLVLRHRQYDIAPLKDARDKAGETFAVLVGTDDYPTRVLTESDAPGVTYPEDARVEYPPISYRPFFITDPEGSCRDIIGVATNAITPFFSQRHKVIESMERFGREEGESFLVKDNVTLAEDGMPQIDERKLPIDRDALRFVHVDLSSSVDSTGIAMVRYDGHKPVPNPNNPELFDLLPSFVVEMACSIKPDSVHQIDPAEVRQWVTQLITHHGFNIQRVSYDGFQSKESLRQYRKAGVASKLISVDKTSDPYKTFRSALYEDRVTLVPNDVLRQELISLEYRPDKDKVDHPPKGRKDISDAVCGALFSANNSRLVRESNAIVNSSGRPQGREQGVKVRDVGRRQDMQRR